MRESNLVEKIKAACMAYVILILLYLAFTISVYGDTVDANGNNFPVRVLADQSTQPPARTGRAVDEARESTSFRQLPSGVTDSRGGENNLSGGVESRHAATTTSREAVKEGVDRDNIMDASSHSGSSAPPAQNSLGSTGNGGKPNQLVSDVVQLARTPCSSSRDGEQGSGMLPVRIGVVATAQNLSPAELYARLIDERYIPWTEPAILKGNSFADRLRESQ